MNPHTSEEVLAFSYYTFPDTAINSKIKPKINKKIDELFSVSGSDTESLEQDGILEPASSETRTLSPQYSDLDVRMDMMKSLGLNELPKIIPDSIDASSGIIEKETSILKKYNFEKLLEDARSR